MEASLLREPDRRAIAEEEARRLVAAAIERIDANRTARSELIDVLGEPRRPWIGAAIGEPDLAGALDEARAAVEAGADLLEVEVPIGRELSERLQRAGVDAADLAAAIRLDLRDGRRSTRRRPAASGPSAGCAAPSTRRPPSAAATSGSGWSRRRSARRRAPWSRASSGSTSPGRTRSSRSSTATSRRIGPSPTTPSPRRSWRGPVSRSSSGRGRWSSGPDLARGVPSDPAIRAGRALALQLVAVALARGNGLPADQILIGGLTPWLADETEPVARAAGEIALRRALLPAHGLVFDEPQPVSRAGRRALAGPRQRPPAGHLDGRDRPPPARSPDDPRVPGRGRGRDRPRHGRSSRAPLTGRALAHARATADAALRTLEQMADDGWRAVIGDTPAPGANARIGADAVAERSDSFDPLGRELSRAG